MGPTWDPQDPGGPHVGPMNFVIRDTVIHVKGYANHPVVIGNMDVFWGKIILCRVRSRSGCELRTHIYG